MLLDVPLQAAEINVPLIDVIVDPLFAVAEAGYIKPGVNIIEGNTYGI